MKVRVYVFKDGEEVFIRIGTGFNCHIIFSPNGEILEQAYEFKEEIIAQFRELIKSEKCKELLNRNNIPATFDYRAKKFSKELKKLCERYSIDQRPEYDDSTYIDVVDTLENDCYFEVEIS